MNLLWTTENAIAFAKELEHKLDPLKMHVALAGSCLYNGGSLNDLDIHVYLEDPGSKTIDDMLAKIQEVTGLHIEPCMDKTYPGGTYEVFTCQDKLGRVIDIFFTEKIGRPIPETDEM